MSVWLECAAHQRRLAHAFRRLARRWPDHAITDEDVARRCFASARAYLQLERESRHAQRAA